MAIAAKMGDKVIGTDIHIIMVPSPGGPVPTPFNGTITGGCSTDVMIGEAVGTVMIGP